VTGCQKKKTNRSPKLVAHKAANKQTDKNRQTNRQKTDKTNAGKTITSLII